MSRLPGSEKFTLDPESIDRLRDLGHEAHVEADDVLLRQGEPLHSFFVVLDGTLAVETKTAEGVQRINTLTTGGFFGSVNSLSGRPSYVTGRMLTQGRILTVPRSALANLLQSDTELGAFLMKVFILRNLDAVEHAFGGNVLIGSLGSVDTLRIHDLLTRDAMPFHFLDLERDPTSDAFVSSMSISRADLPILLCGTGQVLRNPSNIANVLNVPLRV